MGLGLMETEMKTGDSDDLFQIRVQSVPTNIPLRFDLFLPVNYNMVCFRKKGDSFSRLRKKLLLMQGAKFFHIPEKFKGEYLLSLQDISRTAGSLAEKSAYIKEAAFFHIHELFTRSDLKPAVGEAQSVVQDMVGLICSNNKAMSSLLQLSVHDYYTYNHSVDVAIYSIALARKVYGNDKKMLFLAGFSGFLHDIGKRRIDINIINKPGKLTKEEWEEIKRHPEYGKEYLKNVTVPQEVKDVVFQHHENIDGTGYPQSLTGEEITMLSRIVRVSDTFDALTNNRPYQKALAPGAAIEVMKSLQPGKFDPTVFSPFTEDWKKKPPRIAGV